MANINGANYEKEFNSDPSQPANIGEYGGKVKVMLDSFSGAAGSDVVYFGKIPVGAKVLSVDHIGAGTAPVFNVAKGDKILATQDLICTLDGDASASGQLFCQYVLD
jgi:hypothetical protein